MFKRFRDDMKKYWKYAIYSSKAQLKAEVANSYLNWLWWVLDPLCFMLIYVFMFGYVFKSKEQYFAIFDFCRHHSLGPFLTSVCCRVSRSSRTTNQSYPKYIYQNSSFWLSEYVSTASRCAFLC